jgi:hypothetical protein
MFECKVYRDSWLRGEPGAGTLFRRSDNKMCCLGQVGFQAGIPLATMLSVGDFTDLPRTVEEPIDLVDLRGLVSVEIQEDYDFHPEDEGYLYVDTVSSTEADRAMKVNDRAGITDAEREAEITAQLAIANVAVTFVDGVAPWFLS